MHSEPARRAAELAARSSYGKLVAILAMQNRNIAGAEDALSEALLSALDVRPAKGVPFNPEACLVTAAHNRLRNARGPGRSNALPNPRLRADLLRCPTLPKCPTFPKCPTTGCA